MSDELTVRFMLRGGGYEDRKTTAGELVGKLINGASLRTFMIPDSSIPSNYPEHHETYDLPDVIVAGEYFWAKSRTLHLKPEDGSTAAYCYTNIGNVFCAVNPIHNQVILMSKKRYRTHRWLIRENYQLIWDSDAGHSPELIENEILAGAKFKIAMLDSEDVWNIHSVDLPMYYPDERKFTLKTVMEAYPVFFRYPPATTKMLIEGKDFFETKPSSNKNGILTVSPFQVFFTFYAVSSDGTYSNFFDIQRGTVQEYRRLKVFTDKKE